LAQAARILSALRARLKWDTNRSGNDASIVVTHLAALADALEPPDAASSPRWNMPMSRSEHSSTRRRSSLSNSPYDDATMLGRISVLCCARDRVRRRRWVAKNWRTSFAEPCASPLAPRSRHRASERASIAATRSRQVDEVWTSEMTSTCLASTATASEWPAAALDPTFPARGAVASAAGCRGDVLMAADGDGAEVFDGRADAGKPGDVGGDPGAGGDAGAARVDGRSGAAGACGAGSGSVVESAPSALSLCRSLVSSRVVGSPRCPSLPASASASLAAGTWGPAPAPTSSSPAVGEAGRDFPRPSCSAAPSQSGRGSSAATADCSPAARSVTSETAPSSA
jgi:hypothetical protein